MSENMNVLDFIRLEEYVFVFVIVFEVGYGWKKWRIVFVENKEIYRRKNMICGILYTVKGV